MSSLDKDEKRNTYLQYDAAIQFDQLLKVVLTLDTSLVIESLLPSKLSITISPNPLLLLHCIAVVICGILE